MTLDERAFRSDIGGSVNSNFGHINISELAYGVITSIGGAYGDHDFYAITTQPGVRYTIILQGYAWPTLTSTANPMPYFIMRNVNGGYIDASSYSNGSEIYSFIANSYATYFIDVQGYLSSSTGGYQLFVNTPMADDNDGTRNIAITAGNTTIGRLEQASDSDIYAVSIEAGSSYFFSIFSSTITDLFGYVKDGTGAALTYQSLGSSTSGTFTASTSTTAYLGIASDSFIQLGQYQIFFQQRLAPEYALEIGTVGPDTFTYTGSQSREIWGWDGSDNIDGGLGSDFFIGGHGNDSFNGGGGTSLDFAIWESRATNYTLTFSNGAAVVTDRAGADGVDTLRNVEALVFPDKFVIVQSAEHGAYTDLPISLYHFFIVAFNAVPGVTYMDQLAEAYRYGLSVEQITEIFTTKPEFTDVYPISLSHHDLATRLANNIIKSSATEQAKEEAVNDIAGALDAGWTVGQVVYTVFGNLANKALNDPIWGNTAHQFSNEIAVARYYTETLHQSTTSLDTLRDVIELVGPDADVSTDVEIANLIGVALMA